ncbi:MAG: hypothetical protein WD766_03320 [Gemmatimonadota bacterium]
MRSLCRSVCLLVFFAAVPAAALAQNAASGDREVPRTEHGFPDLQGVWTNETLTPLERPEGMPLVIPPDLAARLADETYSSRAGGVDAGIGTYDEVYYAHGDGLAVVDGELRSSLITVPADGRIPELTAAGRESIATARALAQQFGPADNPENRSLADRCLTSFGSNAGPPMLPNGYYNNNYSIAQTPDHVMIMTEMIHDTRIIRIGEPDPLPANIRSWFGDSWARWEADTLVVETTNFHPLQRFQGLPSDDLKVTERFHRADENTLLYRFTVEDPTNYTEPWGGEVPMVPLDGQMYEYACHEGNYAMEGILAGARAEERATAEAEPSQ